MLKALFALSLLGGTATLLAAIDAQGWVLIIGALFFGVAQVLSLVLTWVAKTHYKRELLPEVQKVHELVNSQRAVLLDRIGELEKLLAASVKREANQGNKEP